MGIKQGGIAAMLAASVLMLAGCDGVGDGSAPDPSTAIKFDKAGGTALLGEDKKYVVYTCVPDLLEYPIGYTKGTFPENFADRAKWSSNNEAVLNVSNAGARAFPVDTDEDGNPLYFQRGGYLFPFKEGEAVITADFKGIKLSKTYRVRNPQNIKVSAAGAFAPDARSITLAHTTVQPVLLSGQLDGIDVDLSFAIDRWVFDTPDETVAKLEAASVAGVNVRATEKSSTTALTLRPVLQVCPDKSSTLLTNAYIDVKVAPATKLLVQREFDTMPSGNVMAVVDPGAETSILTSEVLRIWAAFDEAGAVPEQDVSNLSFSNSRQSFLYAKSSDANVLIAGGAVLGKTSAVRAVNTAKPETGTTTPETSAPVTVDFCLTTPPPDPLPPDDPTTPDVNESGVYPIGCRAAKTDTLTYIVKKKTLQSIAVTPSADLTPLAALGRLQFLATGTFTDGTQQDLTRHVNWTSSDTVRAPVITGVTVGAGLVRSPLIDNVDETSSVDPVTQRTVTIKATQDKATVTKTQEVRIRLTQ